MTTALEIKPGKYRTREGSVLEIVHQSDHYWFERGYAWRAISDLGREVFLTVDGRYRSQALYGNEARHDSPLDLIERIEDEPKHWTPIAPMFPLMPVSVGLDVSAVGKDQTCVVTGAIDRRALEDSKLHEFTLDVVSLAWRARVSELEAKIARLEAENESLSSQLRSRAINAEPASSGKVWRWSPLV